MQVRVLKVNGDRPARAIVRGRSGRNIGDELNLQLKDLILDLQLLLLEPPQLEFIVTGQGGEPVDHIVEIAMLDLQLDDAALDLLFIHVEEGSLTPAMTCMP